MATRSKRREIYRHYEEQLAVAQRAHNKQRVRRSTPRSKSLARIFYTRLARTLADRYALIAVGDVKRNSLHKTRMAKSVLDAGWSTFRAMLKYKSAGYVEVDEKFTTQTCAECGSIAGPKGQAGLSKREWICDGCGVKPRQRCELCHRDFISRPECSGSWSRKPGSRMTQDFASVCANRISTIARIKSALEARALPYQPEINRVAFGDLAELLAPQRRRGALE